MNTRFNLSQEMQAVHLGQAEKSRHSREAAFRVPAPRRQREATIGLRELNDWLPNAWKRREVERGRMDDLEGGGP